MASGVSHWTLSLPSKFDYDVGEDSDSVVQIFRTDPFMNAVVLLDNPQALSDITPRTFRIGFSAPLAMFST